MSRYFKRIGGVGSCNDIYFWKSKGLSLKQDNATYNPRIIVNIYIVYETSKNYYISSFPTL